MHLSAQTLSSLMLIPDGPAGIEATLRIMTRLVKDAKKALVVREKAMSLTRDLKQKDWSGEIRSLHAFVRDDVRYVNDIDEVETVQGPEYTLQVMAGDCDDKSTLLAALLGSIGHPSRFVAIGFAPNVYSHVYIETLIGDTWIALETTEPVECGWEPPARLVKARMYSNN